jgi:hypothetical protein
VSAQYKYPKGKDSLGRGAEGDPSLASMAGWPGLEGIQRGGPPLLSSMLGQPARSYQALSRGKCSGVSGPPLPAPPTLQTCQAMRLAGCGLAWLIVPPIHIQLLSSAPSLPTWEVSECWQEWGKNSKGLLPEKLTYRGHSGGRKSWAGSQSCSRWSGCG